MEHFGFENQPTHKCIEEKFPSKSHLTKQWRKVVMLHHPDRVHIHKKHNRTQEQATEIFQKIERVYNQLSKFFDDDGNFRPPPKVASPKARRRGVKIIGSVCANVMRVNGLLVEGNNPSISYHLECGSHVEKSESVYIEKPNSSKSYDVGCEVNIENATVNQDFIFTLFMRRNQNGHNHAVGEGKLLHDLFKRKRNKLEYEGAVRLYRGGKIRAVLDVQVLVEETAGSPENRKQHRSPAPDPQPKTPSSPHTKKSKKEHKSHSKKHKKNRKASPSPPFSFSQPWPSSPPFSPAARPSNAKDMMNNSSAAAAGMAGVFAQTPTAPPVFPTFVNPPEPVPEPETDDDFYGWDEDDFEEVASPGGKENDSNVNDLIKLDADGNLISQYLPKEEVMRYYNETIKILSETGVKVQ